MPQALQTSSIAQMLTLLTFALTLGQVVSASDGAEPSPYASCRLHALRPLTGGDSNSPLTGDINCADRSHEVPKTGILTWTFQNLEERRQANEFGALLAQKKQELMSNNEVELRRIRDCLRQMTTWQSEVNGAYCQEKTKIIQQQMLPLHGSARVLLALSETQPLATNSTWTRAPLNYVNAELQSPHNWLLRDAHGPRERLTEREQLFATQQIERALKGSPQDPSNPVVLPRSMIGTRAKLLNLQSNARTLLAAQYTRFPTLQFIRPQNPKPADVAEAIETQLQIAERRSRANEQTAAALRNSTWTDMDQLYGLIESENLVNQVLLEHPEFCDMATAIAAHQSNSRIRQAAGLFTGFQVLRRIRSYLPSVAGSALAVLPDSERRQRMDADLEAALSTPPGIDPSVSLSKINEEMRMMQTEEFAQGLMGISGSITLMTVYETIRSLSEL